MSEEPPYDPLGGAGIEAELDAEDERAAIQGVEADEPPRVLLRHIADIVAERREAQWLKGLHKTLERNVLAVLAGSRNTFKSFIAHHWAMTAGLNGESVVILSAEGAGLDRRTDAWMRTYAPHVDLRRLNIVAMERAVNLNSSEIVKELQEAIGGHYDITGKKVGNWPALILIDTYSKFAPGLDENDNAEVALYLAKLSVDLRLYFEGCTVLLVAHAGHADAKRPRGASVLMANPDAEYIVERPDPTAMMATVSRERFKDSASMAKLAYAAEVIDVGRLDRYGEPVTSLVMRDTEAAAVVEVKLPALRGKAQKQMLAMLRAETNGTEGRIWTLEDMRALGRKGGMSKATARSAVEALTFTPHMTATTGGYRLSNA